MKKRDKIVFSIIIVVIVILFVLSIFTTLHYAGQFDNKQKIIAEKQESFSSRIDKLEIKVESIIQDKPLKQTVTSSTSKIEVEKKPDVKIENKVVEDIPYVEPEVKRYDTLKSEKIDEKDFKPQLNIIRVTEKLKSTILTCDEKTPCILELR